MVHSQLSFHQLSVVEKQNTSLPPSTVIVCFPVASCFLVVGFSGRTVLLLLFGFWQPSQPSCHVSFRRVLLLALTPVLGGGLFFAVLLSFFFLLHFSPLPSKPVPKRKKKTHPTSVVVLGWTLCHHFTSTTNHLNDHNRHNHCNHCNRHLLLHFHLCLTNRRFGVFHIVHTVQRSSNQVRRRRRRRSVVDRVLGARGGCQRCSHHPCAGRGRALQGAEKKI